MGKRNLIAPAVVPLLLVGVLTGCGKKKPQPGEVDGYIYIPSARVAGGTLSIAVFPEPVASTSATGGPLVPLVGAEVRVSRTDLRVRSDAQGYFRISGVPAGLRTLVVTYGELEPLIIMLEVPAGKLVHADSRPTASPVSEQ